MIGNYNKECSFSSEIILGYIQHMCYLLFFEFLRMSVLFVEPLIRQYRTSGDICP